MKIQRALGLLFLGMALILTACKVENTADTTTELAQNKNSTTSGRMTQQQQKSTPVE